MPSRASGVALSAAIRCAVPSISGAIDRPPRSRIRRLAAAIAAGPLQELGQHALDRGIELLGRNHFVHQPDHAASAALIRSPVSISRRAWRGPIAASTYGPITEGISPRRTSVVPKVACCARHHDVAAGDEAGAAAERRAVDPGDGRLGQLVQGLHQPAARASARLSASP